MKRNIINCKLTLLIVVICMAKVKSDTFDECDGAKPLTFVVGSQNCSHYVFCNDESSFDGYCDGAFNQVAQVCDSPSENCNVDFDNNQSSVSTPAITIMTSNVVSASTTATAMAITTPIINAIINDTDTITTLNDAQHLSSTTDGGSTIVAPNTSTTAVTSSTTADYIIATECPSVDNPQKIVLLPHPKSCSDYYVCFHGSAIPMYCSAMLHFNVRTGKCDYPQNVRCQANFSTPKEQCQSHTEDLYPHPNNCNYFYYCKKGYLMLQQCPFYYGWDTESRLCVTFNEARCFNNTKRV